MRPICLPDPAQDYDNVSALVTGWGRNSSSGPPSNILQEATVTTMTNSQCRSSSHRHDRITENMICAKAAGRDACKGDACRASNGYNEAEDRVDITVVDLQVQDSCVDNPNIGDCKRSKDLGNKTNG